MMTQARVAAEAGLGGYGGVRAQPGLAMGGDEPGALSSLTQAQLSARMRGR